MLPAAQQGSVPAPGASEHFVGLGNALAWPLTVDLVVRRPLTEFLERLGGRIAIVRTPGTPRNELARAIVRRRGPFVANVNEQGEFKDLVDRLAVLESVGEAVRDAPAENGS